MKKLVTIADWADDSLTCQEHRSTVNGFLKQSQNADIHYVGSTPSTIHGAFLLSQIVETEERYGSPLETVIFLNVDPRLHTEDAVENARGAELLIIKLQSGVYIIGPNAGYDFSMIKNKIGMSFTYPGLAEGSQFRSRDLYARICAHLMDEMEDELELEETSTNVIPELTGYHLVHVDNFGNLKTNIKHSYFKGKHEEKAMVKIKIGPVEKSVKYVNNMFGTVSGDLVVYPGSSGIKSDPFLEITIRRTFLEEKPATGWEEFKFPRPGTKIEIQ